MAAEHKPRNVVIKLHFTEESQTMKLLSQLKPKSRKLNCQRKQSTGAPAGMRAGGVRGSEAAARTGSTCTRGGMNFEAAPGHQESCQWKGMAAIRTWEPGRHS